MKSEISEHLLVIVASVSLCAGGVYFWAHLHQRSHGRLELQAWTPEDTHQFKSCVKEHLSDWKHYVLPPASVLVKQLTEVLSGETCRANLPLLDEAKRKQLMMETRLDRDEFNQLQEGLRVKGFRLPPLGSESVEQPGTALPSGISPTNAVSLKELQDLVDKLSANSSQPLPQEDNAESRFIVKSKTILDNKSGLMWMSDDYRTLEERFPGTWYEAMSWPEKVNLQRYAGYSDWSVPTLAQYRTLNKSLEDRRTYARVFPQTEATEFWTRDQPFKSVASEISFADGSAVSPATSPAFGRPYTISVRLVRVNGLN